MKPPTVYFPKKGRELIATEISGSEMGAQAAARRLRNLYRGKLPGLHVRVYPRSIKAGGATIRLYVTLATCSQVVPPAGDA